MQKLDYIKALEEIQEQLNVSVLYEFFIEGRVNYDKNYSGALPILLDTYLKYNKLIESHNNVSVVLNNLPNILDIFEHNSFSKFIENVSRIKNVSEMRNHIAKNFIQAYKFIIDLYTVNKTILLNEFTTNEEEELERGTILFRVRSDNEQISAETYSQIFKAINELIEVVSKLYGITDAPIIVLLDSGSDTNLGVKTAVEIAQSVFTIFAETLDYIINFSFAKDDRKMKKLQDSLTIRSQIQQAAKAGVITKEEESQYIHLIKSRTDKLIGLHVTPRKAMDDAIAKSNSSGWLAFKQQYLLEQENKQEE